MLIFDDDDLKWMAKGGGFEPPLVIKRKLPRLNTSNKGFNLTPYPNHQSVIVKSSFKNTNFSSQALLNHFSYINRDEANKDKKIVTEKKTYNQSKESLDKYQLRFSEKEKRFFKLIVSPKNTSHLNWENYIRDYMKEINNVTGYNLDWCSAIHTNTANPHAHIIIRGIDTLGKQVTFPKDFFTKEFRFIASHVATQHLGYKNQYELGSRIEPPAFMDKYDFSSIQSKIINQENARKKICKADENELTLKTYKNRFLVIFNNKLVSLTQKSFSKYFTSDKKIIASKEDSLKNIINRVGVTTQKFVATGRTFLSEYEHELRRKEYIKNANTKYGMKILKENNKSFLFSYNSKVSWISKKYIDKVVSNVKDPLRYKRLQNNIMENGIDQNLVIKGKSRGISL